MSFVVKVTSPRGVVLWVSRPGMDAIRTIGLREMADVFQDQAAARDAIAKLLVPFADAGFVFLVEHADGSPLE